MSEEKKEKDFEDSNNAEESSFFTDDPMERFEKSKKPKKNKDAKKSESDHSDENSKEKNKSNNSGGLKKKIKFVIIGVVVVAVLAGGVAIISNSGIASKSSNGEETTEVETGDLTILKDENANKVKTVDVKKGDTKYTVYRSKEAEGDDSAVFSIKGYEDYNLDTSVLSTLANNAIGLTTYEKIAEKCDNLDKYGLGDDAVIVKVTCDDGTKRTFRVGNVTTDSEYTYFCLDGDDTVYTVQSSKLSNYSYTPTDFVSKTIVDTPSDSDAYVKSLTIKRKDLDYDIKLSYDKSLKNKNKDANSSQVSSNNSYPIYLKMTSPVNVAIETKKSESCVNGVFGLSASEIVKLSPSDDDLKKYGLDKPSTTVDFTLKDGDKVKLEIGGSYKNEDAEALAKIGGVEDASDESNQPSDYYYYVRCSENPDIIYTVGSNALPWVNLVPIDITSKIIFNSYVWDVGNLTLTADGKTLKFAGEGSDKDDYVVTANGKKCDSERYREFYAFMIKAYGEEIAVNAKPKGDPILTINVSEQDGSNSKKVEFYDDGNLKCLVSVNGEPTFRCRKSIADAIIYDIGIFESNKELKTSFE